MKRVSESHVPRQIKIGERNSKTRNGSHSIFDTTFAWARMQPSFGYPCKYATPHSNATWYKSFWGLKNCTRSQSSKKKSLCKTGNVCQDFRFVFESKMKRGKISLPSTREAIEFMETHTRSSVPPIDEGVPPHKPKPVEHKVWLVAPKAPRTKSFIPKQEAYSANYCGMNEWVTREKLSCKREEESAPICYVAPP